jgi:hypothetical protein
MLLHFLIIGPKGLRRAAEYAHFHRWYRQPAEDDDLHHLHPVHGSGGGGASAAP